MENESLLFIERLWHSLKHNDIYLKDYAEGGEAHIDVAACFAFYNEPPPASGAGGSYADGGAGLASAVIARHG